MSGSRDFPRGQGSVGAQWNSRTTALLLPGSPVSRAVCRTCWTWYANGESICPKCKTRLVGADIRPSASAVDAASRIAPTPTPATPTPPAVPVQPTAEAPFPAPVQSGSSGISWPIWLLIGGGAVAVLAVIGLLVLGLSLTGALGPVTSSDGAISVKVPKGWAQGAAAPLTTGKPVLALARLNRTNGVEPHFIVVDLEQLVPLSTIEYGWDPFIRSGKVSIAGSFGGLSRTTVGGAPALSVDFHGSKYAGQLLFVDYGSKTYIVEMTSDPSEFDEVRDGDLAAILSSWQWH
jgi:hypothetical protein